MSKATNGRSSLGRSPKTGGLPTSPPQLPQCGGGDGIEEGKEQQGDKQSRKEKKALNRRYILFVGTCYEYLHVQLLLELPSLCFPSSSVFFSFSSSGSGNLPFSATSEDVKEHFRRRGVPVIDVRMLTEKESGRSRGCCFVEFANDKSQQVK